ncbi:MAG: hypothetical protein JNL05_09940 [Flavobacteriales bacterium]|nr:hypothetical protein [Flavobacteriales bacterium]
MIQRYAIVPALLFPLLLGAQTQNALDLDGVNDEVNVNNASALVANSTNGFSLTCWVYPTQSANWPNMEAFAGFRDNATCDFYLLQTYGTTLEGRFRNSNGGIFTIDSLGVLTLNSWQHLALTYDGSLLAMYRNGTLVKSVAASGSITSQNGMFRIGNMPIPGSTQIFLDGQVDETTLWKRGLTAAEVQCVMNYGADPSDADLKLYYKMDQGTAGGSNAGATTLVNAAGGNNATLVGFALSGATSNYVDGCPVAGTLVETICPGETYTFNGQAYTAAGTYTANYPVGGCDSLATLDLRVTPVNINVVQSGNNLVAQATGAQYQWLDCANGYAEITGATAPSYSLAVAGSYAVEVTQNGCVDTSACYSNVGIGELGLLRDLQVTVDAANDQVVVSGAPAAADLNVVLLDAGGRMVITVKGRGGRVTLPLAGVPDGLYLVSTSSGAVQRTFRVVVQR